MTRFSNFYLITNGYAFIKRISFTEECTDWGEPFCSIESHNHTTPQQGSTCFMAISQCIDPYIVLNTINANQFCITDPITPNYTGVYNTGGTLGSWFSPGYILSLNSPGTYQLTLIGIPSNANTSGNSAVIYRKEWHNENIFENIVSGFRIKSVKDYTNLDVLSTEKVYQYTHDFEGLHSSTKLLEKNRGISVSQSYKKSCYVTQQGTSLQEGIDRLYNIGAYEANSSQENVVYRSVFEIHKIDSIQMGYTHHKFNVGQSGFISLGGAEKYYEHNETFGKPTEISTYSKDNELINQQRNEYRYFNDNSNQNYTTNTGFSVRIIPDLGEGKSHLILYKRPQIQDYGLFYYHPEWVGLAIGGALSCTFPSPLTSSIINMIKEQILETDDIFGYDNYGAYDYELVPQFATSIFGAQIKKTSIEYLPNGELVTEQEFRYDQSNYNLLRETKTTDLSDNSTISQVNYYPSDYIQYDSMIGDNRLTEVIKTETYRNGELLQVRENEYANHVNGWFPSVVKIAKGEQDLEPRMFIKYDYAGNIIEIKNSEDPTSETVESYIWGYNKKYPVAKIAGVQHQNIPANQITAIENVTVYDCAPELNANLLTAYQNLQNALPTAQITFYSYHANGKLKAMTSPNGQTMYYHYDELQRLVKVVDQYGAILSENEYKFRTQN
ncbi:RHS repeat domain-containing protein [Flavobacterium filum]|uniref:RHS repeat domain-containing protein n=1 Tax=Flavobacterium filum TaxID=370974 RepID=UPI0004793B11|nr:RHS repeat domain-containing protein [Flavobacterium filum]